MRTPDDLGAGEARLTEAFADLAHATEAMVDPVEVGVLYGRVRRRRTTRSAVAAGLAAVLVAAPAVWWLQDSEGRENEVPPVGETSESVTAAPSSPQEGPASPSAPDHEGEQGAGDVPLPTFADLVGAEVDLPEFGAAGDAGCAGSPAVLANGVPDWYGLERFIEAGEEAELLKVIHVPLEEGGPAEAVALVQCRRGDPPARQAVVVAGDGQGGWEVTEQLVASGDPNGAVEDLAPASGYGVTLLMRETESCCAGHRSESGAPAVWYLLSRPRDAEPLVEVDDPGPGAMVTDLFASIDVTEDAAGVWTARVRVSNIGDRASAPFLLSLCGSEHAELEGVDLPMCDEIDHPGLEVLDALEPGAVFERSWTMAVPPTSEWNGNELEEGIGVVVRVQMLRFSADPLVFDPFMVSDAGNAVIAAAQME